MTVKTKPERQQREISASADASFEIRRLTLDEYHRLVEIGFFPPTERVELVEGVLHYMTPRGPRHAECLTRLLRTLYGAGDTVAPLHFPDCEIDVGDVLPQRQTDTT